MKKLQILGTGCPKCKMLADAVLQAAKESGIEYDLIQVSDMNEILRYGIMTTPALVIDGKVRVVGYVPTRDELRSMLL